MKKLCASLILSNCFLKHWKHCIFRGGNRNQYLFVLIFFVYNSKPVFSCRKYERRSLVHIGMFINERDVV